MKRLKIILNSKIFYILLIVITFIYFFAFNNISRKTKIDLNSKIFEGIITNYKIDKNLLTLEIKGKEKIIAYYYFNSLEEINNFNYKLGDKVLLTGTFSIPSNNTIPNGFNYKEYLYHKYIYVVMNADSIKKINNNANWFYHIKNTINDHIDKYKSKNYLKTFIIGDKSLLDKDIYKTYQNNGISHLLAISGMHISLLSTFIIFILNKFLNKKLSLIITSLFLIFYMFLAGLTASVVRSSILFGLLALNKIFNLEIKTVKVLFFTFIILLLFNPFYIYDIGFIYSFVISFFLIVLSKKLNSKSYLKNVFLISLISFFVSLPITLYNSYEINFFSIILNIFFVPLVSFIVFPLSLLTFFIPILDNIFLIVTNVLEKLSYYSNNINYFKFIFGKVSIIFIITYYLILISFFKTNKKIFLIIIFIILLIQYSLNIIVPRKYVISIDVGQGDSILVHTNNKTVLIDTGGKVSFQQDEWKKKNPSIIINKLIPMFKSFGIKKIDYLILSHGDYDHMGEAINLVNNFKVEKVIFNCGSYNNLEKELIKVLDKKKIKYYSCIKELNIDKNKLYFLQTKEYDNENDNSNVIYTELNGYKFMFMGDASITTEKEIMSIYNLPEIDVLKVGHHGCRTSSSKEFINEIDPRYSIISVGKNNRYGHPNKEALNNLNNSKIYRTDIDGSIMFEIKNNKLKIETCIP